MPTFLEWNAKNSLSYSATLSDAKKKEEKYARIRCERRVFRSL